jgi:RNA polymerase sigma factor (sigma-70 family)
MPPSPPEHGPASGGRFATTHWSLIVAAREGEATQAQEALAALCRAYWYPLYGYIRHQGHAADRAQDLTQEFFARLLEKDFLAAVDREKGKFRSFLLAACKHFLANEHDRECARKRGGGRQALSLDLRDAVGRYAHEPAHGETPERLFERRWALALLEQVLARLRREYEAAGKGRLFGVLKSRLTGGGGVAYARAAAELGLSEGSIKVAVHRLRKRYRELLHEEIAQTLDDPGQVEEEILALFAALGPEKSASRL